MRINNQITIKKVNKKIIYHNQMIDLIESLPKPCVIYCDHGDNVLSTAMTLQEKNLKVLAHFKGLSYDTYRVLYDSFDSGNFDVLVFDGHWYSDHSKAKSIIHKSLPTNIGEYLLHLDKFKGLQESVLFFSGDDFNSLVERDNADINNIARLMGCTNDFEFKAFIESVEENEN